MKQINSKKVDKTKEVYGLLWEKTDIVNLPGSSHFDKMQEAIPEKIVRGKLGIDIGSGCGYDTYIMAKDNPSVKIISGVFDFAYCFGVLHHAPDPARCLSEIARILKKQSPVFLYLYEDHSENVLKYLALKAVTFLRMITTRIPRKVLYILSFLASPFIFILFSWPAIILRKFKATQRLAENIPFNFGTSLFGLGADLYDRFAAPIEHRFSKSEIYDILEAYNFSNINVTKLKATAGWVAWAYKNA